MIGRGAEPIPSHPRPTHVTNRPVRLLAVAVLAALFAVASPVGRAYACSCAMLGPAERLAGADAAFVGVVVALADPQLAQRELSIDPVRYTFAVDESLKGSLANVVLVTSSHDNGGNCGMDFAAAQRWRVYAYVDESGQLTTNGCSGNELLADRAPIPNVTEQAPRPPPVGLLIALGASGVVTLASIWAFYGEREGRRPR
jgi:hypothetical protein